MKPRTRLITPNSHNRIDKLQQEIKDLQRAPLTYEVVLTSEIQLAVSKGKGKRHNVGATPNLDEYTATGAVRLQALHTSNGVGTINPPAGTLTTADIRHVTSLGPFLAIVPAPPFFPPYVGSSFSFNVNLPAAIDGVNGKAYLLVSVEAFVHGDTAASTPSASGWNELATIEVPYGNFSAPLPGAGTFENIHLRLTVFERDVSFDEGITTITISNYYGGNQNGVFADVYAVKNGTNAIVLAQEVHSTPPSMGSSLLFDLVAGPSYPAIVFYAFNTLGFWYELIGGGVDESNPSLVNTSIDEDTTVYPADWSPFVEKTYIVEWDAAGYRSATFTANNPTLEFKARTFVVPDGTVHEWESFQDVMLSDGFPEVPYPADSGFPLFAAGIVLLLS